MVKMSRAMALLCVSLCGACGADFENPVEFDDTATFEETADFDEAETEAEIDGEGEAENTAQVEQGLTRSVMRYRGVNLASAEFGMDSEGHGAVGVHGADYVYPDPAYAAGYTSANYFVGKRMNRLAYGSSIEQWSSGVIS